MCALLSRISVSQPARAVRHGRLQRDGHEFDFLLADLTEGQQVREQPVHRLRGRVDEIGVILALLVEARGVVLHKQLGKALHGAQRCA